LSALAAALLADLSESDLDALAAALAPRLKAHLEPRDDGWLRGASEIASYIGAPRSRVYALASAGRMPLVRDGSNLCARRSELDAWLRAGGAKRP
jgi:excisionase family DNA binding protein